MLASFVPNSVQVAFAPNSTQAAFVHLLWCALNESAPDRELVAEVDLRALHALATRHSADALIAAPLLAHWDALGCADGDREAWIASEAMAQKRSALFALERERIIEWLDDQGIWHMPLKGAVFADLYPSSCVRQMTDIDILFDASYRVYVRDWLISCGYKREDKGDSHHEGFSKNPIYNVEMHRRLFDDEPYESYYRDVKARLVPVAGATCRFTFTPEDNYVYMIAHAAKHYFSAGTGLRTVADAFVLLRAYGETLNWAYIDVECEKLGISAFERALCSLALDLFGTSDARRAEHPLPDDEAAMLNMMLCAGTYGNAATHVRIHTGAGTLGERLAYVRKRAFPPLRVIMMGNPVLRAHPVLIPGFYIFRGVQGLIMGEKRNRARAELKALRELKR